MANRDKTLPALTVAMVPAVATAENDDDQAVSGMALSKEMLTNNTPTPVRQMLREADADGLFQDITTNPFDEYFRKELKKRPPKKRPRGQQQQEETLNTPQILGLLETPTTPNVTETSSAMPIASSPSKSLRAIAPSPPSGGSAVQKAQLLLQLPNGGQQLHLSDIPVVQQQPQSPPTVSTVGEGRDCRGGISSVSPLQSLGECGDRQLSKRRQSQGAQPSDREEDVRVGGDSDSRRAELLERNRAAAQRSRLKRKKHSEELETRARQLAEANRTLSVEVKFLRQELGKAKALLSTHADCPVTIETGQSSVIAELLSSDRVPNAASLQKEHHSLPQVKIIAVKPSDVIQSGRLLSEGSTLDVAGAPLLPSSGDKEDTGQVCQKPSYVRVTPNSISVKKSGKVRLGDGKKRLK